MNYQCRFSELSEFRAVARALQLKQASVLAGDTGFADAEDQMPWRSVARAEELVAQASRDGSLPGFEEQVITYCATIPSRYFVMMGVDLSPLVEDESRPSRRASPLDTTAFSRIRPWLKVAGGPVFSSAGKGYIAAIPGMLGQQFAERMPILPHEGKEVCLSDPADRREFWYGAWVTTRWAAACDLLTELVMETG